MKHGLKILRISSMVDALQLNIKGHFLSTKGSFHLEKLFATKPKKFNEGLDPNLSIHIELCSSTPYQIKQICLNINQIRFSLLIGSTLLHHKYLVFVTKIMEQVFCFDPMYQEGSVSLNHYDNYLAIDLLDALLPQKELRRRQGEVRPHLGNLKAPYRTSQAHQEEVWKQIQDLLERGLASF
ncbi:hypothetical protein O6H91_Y292500 [Diphasiastrum complanatum]|nr:hypothetical protein O6H91_Y292500 [Diphasiastrum complanatum]